jgi:hypothetical protein
VAVGDPNKPVVLKVDADSYNDNNKFGAAIQLSFSCEPDLDEGDQDTDYNPDSDDDDEEGDD